MKSTRLSVPFWLILLAIILLPTAYYFNFPKWVLLILASFLGGVFLIFSWVGLKNLFKKRN
jgi:heme O synthase-like polyprenyltransferase